MKITIKLDKRSINSAIRKLENYQETLENKKKLFLEELARVGIDVANVEYANANTKHQPDVPIVENNPIWVSDNELVVRASGQSILFIEFGSGIHYNGAVGSSPHPKGVEFGYTIGSYGKGNGAKDYWHYKNSLGNWRTTHGTKSTPAMYDASKEMRKQITKIAKKVFKNDKY